LINLNSYNKLTNHVQKREHLYWFNDLCDWFNQYSFCLF